MKRKLVLFDIDGTILLSAGAGRRSILAAVAGQVEFPDRLGTIRFDGKTDPQIVVELLAGAGLPDPAQAERVAAVLDRYVAHLEQDLAVHGHLSRLMPGIPALLDALEADGGVLLGLLTGNVMTGARLKLRAAGLDPDRFRVGAFGSDHAERLALPPIAALRAEPFFGRRPQGREVVIIGDTPADVHCAASIGARTIGVATGGFGVEELRAAGAEAVFLDFSDTVSALEAILS
ncbi:MAG TPA: HAD family hydrolase [Gemmatimonadales bacterium]|nr:HAD family hydrolase [Gemmatimonadales bacterium]